MPGLLLYCFVRLVSCIAGDVIFEEDEINYVKIKITTNLIFNKYSCGSCMNKTIDSQRIIVIPSSFI